MALIPGSYARAAGLQSEISKVTVTRVAGSEVQFRRAIDTYQRDLRFRVNRIGHEQRLLRRSLRRYSKKLQDTQKDQRQRQPKHKEQSGKRKEQSQQCGEAKQASERSVVTEDSSDESSPVENNKSHVPFKFDSDHASREGQPQSATSVLSESPDSGVGSELEDSDSPDSTDAISGNSLADKAKLQRIQKTFLTSSKRKLPYLKAKRRSTNHGKEGKKQDLQVTGTSTTNHVEASAEKSHTDQQLPIIAEEIEETVDQPASASEKSPSARDADLPQEQMEGNPRDANKAADDSQTKIIVKTLPPLVTSLDTKSVSHQGKHLINNGPSLPAITKTNPDQEDSIIHAEEDGSVIVRRKKPRRRAGISYGDLIKLQHTKASSTKQLCQLVDRLASVHGITDPPPLPPNPMSSSLDPRTNVKIKRRSKAFRNPSDGIMKQAAVLYPMKYGYSSPVKSDDSTFPDPLNTSDDIRGYRAREEDPHLRQNRRKSVLKVPDGVPPAHPNDPTLSARRDSIDVTSPFYEFSEVASSLFDDLLSGEASSPAHLSEHRTKTKPRTLTELSEQVTKVRDRAFLRKQNSHTRTDDLDNSQVQQGNGHTLKSHAAEENPPQRAGRRSRVLSPVHHRSRSQSRHQRRDSVDEQLQKRLTDGGEGGKMAWQSAFGRLKMIHTLFDLSQHFAKDSQ